MRSGAALPLLLALTLAGGACDRGGWLSQLGIPSFREIDVEEARALLRQPDALLVQAQDAEARRVDRALRIDETKPLPDPVIQAGGTVVVLATDSRRARRLAARLAREGRSPVAVVRGGVQAWRGAPQAARTRSTDATGSATLRQVARPRPQSSMRPRDREGDRDDGGSARGYGSEL